MTIIEQDIISIIAVLVSCFLAMFIMGAILTAIWLKGERDWHKSNSVKPDKPTENALQNLLQPPPTKEK